MKKIWIGGYTACDVHNEKAMLKQYVINHNFELTDDIAHADIVIITDTCLATYKQFNYSFSWIDNMIGNIKKDAEVILSGCIIKEVIFELTDKQKDILSRVTCVKSEDLVPYIAKLLTGKVTKDDYNIPHSIGEYTIRINPVIGCLNHCSFCKTNYVNFKLKSYPFESVKGLALDIEKVDYPFHYILLYASNLSLYGMDLYGKQRTHEVIETFTKPDKIKFASVGCLINWYLELVDEIIKNPKIKKVFISLESGSPRIYKLMNRPISLENLIQLIRFIKKERPDIIIQTEFIAGYPTETIEDLKRTIDLAYELDVYPALIWPYFDSPQIPSSKLVQHSKFYCEETKYYMETKLLPLHEKFKNMIWNGEMLILEKYENEKFYITLLVDGRMRIVKFKQLDREYKEGDIILPNTVKPKQFVKRKI